MAIGYYGGNHCFATAQEAVNAHYSNESIYVEYMPNEGLYIYRPVLDASNVWKLSVRKPGGIHQTLDSLPTNVVGTCNLDAMSYDYASAAALWGFAFAGVFSLWYLSKNLGMIINAVRRW